MAHEAPSSTAVLFRTRRAGRVIEEALSREGIKYHVLGGSSYWQSPEVKSAVAWIGLSQYPADHLLAAAIRSPFHPAKYLPKQKLLARVKELKTDDQGYWHFLTQEPHQLVEHRNLGSISEFVQFVHSLQRYRNLRAGEAAKQILTALRAFDHYSEEELSADSDPVENLTDLVKIADRFSTVKEFLDHARKVTAASKTKKGVCLSTIHQSKGLQFTHVVLVACQEGVLPHAKSDDLEGERNCYFVACSRAEKTLTITYSGAMSPFLKVSKPDDSERMPELQQCVASN